MTLWRLNISYHWRNLIWKNLGFYCNTKNWQLSNIRLTVNTNILGKWHKNALTFSLRWRNSVSSWFLLYVKEFGDWPPEDTIYRFYIRDSSFPSFPGKVSTTSPFNHWLCRQWSLTTFLTSRLSLSSCHLWRVVGYCFFRIFTSELL